MKHRNYLLLFLLLISASLFAQNPTVDEERIPESRMDQHESFIADETSFPAKPRNMWAVGINVGLLNIGGDVHTRPFGGVGGVALGYGASVRKALGYTTSLRLQYTGGTAYGQNFETQAVGRNSVLETLGYSDGNPFDPTAEADKFVHNYQMKFNEINLDFMLNINNIKFHKSNNSMAIYGFVGGGAMAYKTYYDALDAGGAIYDFSAFDATSANYDNRKDQRDAVEALLDGDFETRAEFDDNKFTMGSGEDEAPVDLFLDLGLGIQFRLGNRVSLDLEHKVLLAFDDLLDGQQWGASRTFTGYNDIMHYTSLGVSIHLGGKSDEPSWFVNPMGYVYNELKEIQPPDMSDSDGDGVIDILDQELETPEGFPVSAKGIALDSDKDGCPDGEDPEPYSSPNFPIVDCKNDMPSFLSADEIETLIDNKLAPVLGGAGSNWFLPVIHFSLNSDRIQTDNYDELSYVADVMKKYPDMKVKVTGHTDKRGGEKYNDDLSRRRAENAINALVDDYGMNRDRFILEHKGEANSVFESARTEAQHKINRRVVFEAQSQD